MLTGSQKQLIELMTVKTENEAIAALHTLESLSFLDRDGNSILQLAQNQNCLNFAREIVLRAPHFRTQANLKLRTPLHDAAEQNKEQFIKLYLHLYIENRHFPCELDCRAEKERTPLHLAAIKGHEKVAMLFKEAGANLHAKDAGNYSAYQYAYVLGRPFASTLQPPMVPSLFTLAAQQAFIHHPELHDAIAECVFQQAQAVVLFHQQNQSESTKRAKSVEDSRSMFFGLVEGFKTLRI